MLHVHVFASPDVGALILEGTFYNPDIGCFVPYRFLLENYPTGAVFTSTNVIARDLVPYTGIETQGYDFYAGCCCSCGVVLPERRNRPDARSIR